MLMRWESVALGKILPVLVIEDEQLILELLQETLEEAGFQVHATSSGLAARKWLDCYGADVTGLLTDVRHGRGPDGWDLARHARRLRPGLPVIYMTADSGAHWLAEGVPHSILLQKPFATGQAVAALNALLDGALSRVPIQPDCRIASMTLRPVR
jgi:DNA-binding response OmpR family regulator